MAITDPNTVLVLGAGVSVPFGMPMGGGLIDKISNRLQLQLHHFNTNERGFHEINYREKYFSQSCIFPLIWKNGGMDDSGRKFNDIDAALEDLQKLKTLESLLSNQTSESIDDFINANPETAPLTKICIAAEFIHSLYRLQGNDVALREITSRYCEPTDQERAENKKVGDRNWIHLLINVIRQGVESGAVKPDNKVQIITFNYDMILEHVLEKQFSNTEKGPTLYPDYRELIDIIHVHGQCGPLEERLHEPAKTCLEWSRGIHVVRERAATIPPEVEEQRKTAIEMVRNAKELYFCGFAFAKANTDLLMVENPNRTKQRRSIYYCNYDGNVGVKKAVEKFDNGAPINPTIVETPVEGVGAADWIKLGNIGELP